MFIQSYNLKPQNIINKINTIDSLNITQLEFIKRRIADLLLEENPIMQRKLFNLLVDIERPDSYKKITLPTNAKFKIEQKNLLNTMQSILEKSYISSGENSEEFQGLLTLTRTTMRAIKECKEARQNLINVLEKAKFDLEYAASGEFFTKLFEKQAIINSADKEYKLNGNEELYIQQGADYSLAIHLRDFFIVADFYGVIEKGEKASIEAALQIVERYLYNQIWKIFIQLEIGNFILSWESIKSKDSTSLSFTYQESNEILTSFVSNFDTTDSIFELFAQKENLNKTQNLKKGFTADSILGVLLKESKK